MQMKRGRPVAQEAPGFAGRQGLLQAQEQERRRIARELHDGLNQELSLLAVEMEMLERQLPEGGSVRCQLERLRERAAGLSDEVRRLSHKLHPAILEHLGLISALESLCHEFTAHKGIRAELSVADEPPCIPPDAALCFYRVTQEALANAAKHSGASEVRVEVRALNGAMRLCVTDPGVGFTTKQAKTKGGLGLAGMRERARLLGGRFTVESLPGRGTRLEVRLPLEGTTRRSEPFALETVA